MEKLDLLEKLQRVQAPPGFEQGVIARLPLAREKRLIRRRIQRLALAGAPAAALAVLALFNVIGFQKGGLVEADKAGGVSRPSVAAPVEVIPVMETLDYVNEMRNQAYEPKTIYILEQVSDLYPAGVKF